jgi:enoyl-CoA hydratase/carnithine racemase
MTELLAQREGEILVLTLNRPDKGNALNEAMQNALVEQLGLAGGEEGIRAVLIGASGSRTFSAGADLKQFAELDAPVASRKRRELLVRTLEALIDFRKPLVAAVQAKALGAGAMIALLADEVVAAETAELAMPEIRHGMPSPIGLVIIAARGGPSVARRLVQGGEPVPAPQAKLLGLVDEVVPAAELRDKAIERARSLAASSGRAFGINKAFMNGRLRAELEAARRFIDAT